MSFAKTPEYAPITDLQTMLRSLHPEQQLGRDGIYGPETQEAVKAFQKQQGLPDNGIVDPATWNALTRAFDEKEIHRIPAEPLQIVLQPFQVIPMGSDNLHVFLLQGMLNALAVLYLELAPIPLTGILDEPTAQGLRFFQNRAGLAETGELDKNTWRHLTHQYRSTVGDGSGRFPVR